MEIWSGFSRDEEKRGVGISLGSFLDYSNSITELLFSCFSDMSVGESRCLVFSREDEKEIDRMAAQFLPDCGVTRPSVFLEAVLLKSWVRVHGQPMSFNPKGNVRTVYVDKDLKVSGGEMFLAIHLKK
ncbi:hypothetical protein ACFL2R_00260 [Patescibacteria group bacterium]